MNFQELIEYRASPAYADSALLSSDRSILSVKSVEIIPREQSSFGYQSANGVVSTQTLGNKTTFNLSDPRHYIDFKNTWFHCDMKIKGASAADADIGAFVETGGIHSMIKNLIVRHGSAEIHRIENYNKLYNIYNLFTNSREYRDRVLGDALDSYEDKYEEQEYDYFPVTFDSHTTTYTDATKTLANMAGIATRELQVGDLLLINNAANAVVGGNAVANIRSSRSVCNVVRVASITDDNTVVLEDSLLRRVEGAADDASPVAGDIGIDSISSIVRVSRRKESIRRDVVSNVADPANIPTYKVAFQIPFGLFQQDEYFPLPFLNQNLEITIEWVEPHLALNVPSSLNLVDDAAAAALKLGYEITNFRLVGRMIEPSADIFEAHRSMWSDSGLVYRMTSIRNFENQLTTGTQFNITHQTNLKSVQNVLSVLTNQNSANSGSVSVAGVREKAQSTFNKKDMSYYKFRVGGLSFPDYGNVNVDNVNSSEAWKQLQLSLDNMYNKIMTPSVSNWEWRDVDSEKFVMGMLFAKEPNVYNTGLDMSLNFLEQEINLKTALQANVDPQTLHTFINYDQVLNISKSAIRLFY